MVNWKNKYLEMKLKYISAKQKVGKTNSTLSLIKKGGIQSKFYVPTQKIKKLIHKYGIGGPGYIPGVTTLDNFEQYNFNEEHIETLINILLTAGEYNINPVITEILQQNNHDIEVSTDKLLFTISSIDVDADPPTWRYNDVLGTFPWHDDGMNLIKDILS